MKLSDICLVIVIAVVTAILLMFTHNNQSCNIAKVYFENECILTVDLSIDSEYDVNGYNGNVHIVVRDGKIKVDEENSPKHLCSKQGFISHSYETIICLPNKISIRIESNDDEIDTVVR